MNTAYADLLLTPEWRNKRAEIIQRDGAACVHCGATKNLQVHHTQYHACQVSGEMKKPWQYEGKYLITLCERCHKAGHQLYTINTFTI
ncbi:MAG: HNH endonuclease [Bacteroidetes bacterium]|jgi:5-methylcytosine-specific restriction endonuclease McrA|nr:MAG: HNH endonuclease [Bacteroidota bacterium]TAE62028.1 MAG: HNH endonuclease [Bacteroidota bacterium]TAF92454.1 MAG: HNH endonuclease [Bacteroidota bacterium]